MFHRLQTAQLAEGSMVWSLVQTCQDGPTEAIDENLLSWKLALVPEMLDQYAPFISAPVSAVQGANDSVHCK